MSARWWSESKQKWQPIDSLPDGHIHNALAKLFYHSTEPVGKFERLYGADPSRIELVPPGVDHAFFSPGDRAGARTAPRPPRRN